MRLLDKLNQLIVGASGKPRIKDVTHIHLHKDGSVTGRTSNGTKLTASMPLHANVIWTPTT